MAIKRTSSNSISNAVKLSTGFASAAIPNTPTIGTATATSDVAATVEYTAAVLGATASTFTATSNPGSVTGTGSSPITVTGLTASTAYTFTVTAGNANGTSAASSASNSITTSAPLSSYESIATVTVGSGGSSSVTFSSIPGTYKHLQLRCMVKNSQLASMYMEINGDTGANYSFHRMYGDGSSVVASGGGGYSFAICGITGTQFGSTIIDILDYTNTNKNTTVRSLSGYDNNGSGYVGLWSSAWYNTNAVSSINLVATTFQQYSQIALYGIKGS